MTFFSGDSIMVLKDETLLVARKVDSSVGPGSSHSVSDDNLPFLQLPQKHVFEAIELADGDDSPAPATAQLWLW